MKKKPNALRSFKEKVSALEYQNNSIIEEREQFRSILNRIQEALNPQQSSYSNRIPFADMPIRVIELVLWRKSVEGMVRPEYQQIENYREIIRWLIKPSTADQSRIIEDFKKGRGF